MTRPLSDEDLRLLIGLLAVCEGAIWGEVDGDLAENLLRRWRQHGPLDADDDRYSVRQLINDLNHRLRYARGEYEEPPEPFPLPR